MTPRCLVLLTTALIVAGCGTSGTTGTGFSAVPTGTAGDTDTAVLGSTQSAASATRHHRPAALNAAAATRYFRAQVAEQWNGPVALGDGRGCLPAGRHRFTCTAYVKNPDRDIDVYGTVVTRGSSMTATARLARGDEIQNWFLKTGGGCKTNAC